MKLLFCHDGPLYKNKEGLYYSVGFNDKLFSRYSILSPDITVAMRVYCKDSNNNVKSQILSNSKVIECPNMCSLSGILLKRKKCIRILKEQILNTDIVIIRLPSFIGNIALKIAKKYNVPYIVELVGCPWDSLWNHGFVGKLLAPYLYITTKFGIKNSKYVIYVTNEFLQNRYPNNSHNIGCSDVDLSYNEYNNSNKVSFDKNKKIVIGTLGIIDVSYKGQEYVIKSIARLKKYGYKIEYQIVGPGDKTRLENIAKKYNVEDNVSFLGSMAHNDVFKWLSNLTLYIQPSKTEGMPRALLEAMSVGCVCLGSRVGGIPELLDNKMLFKKGKYKELANIIINLNNSDFILQRKINLNKVNQFNYDFLQKKRNSFFEEFLNNEIKNRKRK